MFCPKCGKQNNPGVKFCSGCGAALAGVAAPNARPANVPGSNGIPKSNVPSGAPVNQNDPKSNVPPRAPVNPNAPKPNVPPKAPVNLNGQRPQVNQKVLGAQQKVVPGNVQKFPNGQIPANQQNLKGAKKPASAISTKDYMINASLLFAMVLLYGAVAIMLILSLEIKDTVSFESIFSSKPADGITLNEYLSLMSTGNRMFNPTVLSKALSLVIYIFFYSAPVFSVLALVGSIAFKRNIPLHITSATVSFLSGAFMIAVVPVSFRFIPQMKSGLGVKLGLLPDDISLDSFTPLIIIGAVCCVLSIATVIVAVIYNKRRQKQ